MSRHEDFTQVLVVLEVIVLFRDMINKYSRNNASNINRKYDKPAIYLRNNIPQVTNTKMNDHEKQIG